MAHMKCLMRLPYTGDNHILYVERVQNLLYFTAFQAIKTQPQKYERKQWNIKNTDDETFALICTSL